MASGSITPWQIDGETMETVTDFILGGGGANGDYSHEIKRCLLLGRKVMTKIDSRLKSRDITLPTKVHLVKAMAFSIVMYGCESWTIKKAECRRMDAFELGRNINNLRYTDDTTLMVESKELKTLLMKVKEASEKSWLKTQHSAN